MAKCSTVQSNFKLLNWHQNGVRATQLKPPQNSLPKFVGRNFKAPSALLNILKIKTPFQSSGYVARSLRGSSCNCNYLGTLIESENLAASDWIAVTDQVLLIASVFLTYMAGVIPSGKALADSQKGSSQERLPLEPTILGSLEENSDRFQSKCDWDIVREKLQKSLKVIEEDTKDSGIRKYDARQPLSLFAISDGSRVQLLFSSFEQLEKEVFKLAHSSKILERAEWLTTFSMVIQKASQSAFLSWIEQQFTMKNCKLDMAVLSTMSEKLNGDDSILRNIRRSGKLDLFADLLYFLRCSSLRGCGYYDNSLFNLHAVAILEDLVITLADGIASIYLECISVDSDMSDKMPNPAFTLCSLSTRALQKLRNEVAMKQWLHENVESVVSMYEDRFDLCTLQNWRVQEPTKNKSEAHSWIKKFSLHKSATAQPQEQYFVVSNFSLSVKRTKELRALSGWKYYFSLLLELSDILMPLVSAVVAQVRNAISFFLVSLIGRSLGLIYTGIRQSLRWK